ncbi:hypothetical protein [Streptomyces sp. NPDC001205]
MNLSTGQLPPIQEEATKKEREGIMSRQLPLRLRAVSAGTGGSDDSAADGRGAAAVAAREAIEVLEVLWSHGRDLAAIAPVSASQLRVLYILAGDDGINL